MMMMMNMMSMSQFSCAEAGMAWLVMSHHNAVVSRRGAAAWPQIARLESLHDYVEGLLVVYLILGVTGEHLILGSETLV